MVLNTYAYLVMELGFCLALRAWCCLVPMRGYCLSYQHILTYHSGQVSAWEGAGWVGMVIDGFGPPPQSLRLIDTMWILSWN